MFEMHGRKVSQIFMLYEQYRENFSAAEMVRYIKVKLSAISKNAQNVFNLLYT